MKANTLRWDDMTYMQCHDLHENEHNVNDIDCQQIQGDFFNCDAADSRPNFGKFTIPE